MTQPFPLRQRSPHTSIVETHGSDNHDDSCTSAHCNMCDCEPEARCFVTPLPSLKRRLGLGGYFFVGELRRTNLPRAIVVTHV